MDLGLSLRGRATKPLYARVVREVRESDLALLTVERATKPSALQRITERHHALARCLATGMSATEACAVTGYTPSRVSILKGDPAFEELCSHYRGLEGAQVADLQDRMVALALDATAELQNRLEDTPETFAIDELHDVVKLTADRTGYGPKQTNVNVNVNLGDRLAAARQRAATPVVDSPPLIEGRVESASHLPLDLTQGVK